MTTMDSGGIQTIDFIKEKKNESGRVRYGWVGGWTMERGGRKNHRPKKSQKGRHLHHHRSLVILLQHKYYSLTIIQIQK